MAYSDWNIVRRDYRDRGGIFPQPSISGDANIDGGRHYYYYIANTTNIGICGTQTKAHLTNPFYIDLSHNNAISLRAKLKIGNLTTNHIYEPYRVGYSIGLNAYSKDVITTSPSTLNFGGGYTLCLSRRITSIGTVPDTFVTELVIRGMSTHNATPYAWDGTKDLVVCSGTYTTDTWYDVRFDLIPVSLTSKNLIAYTSTDNGITWDQVGIYNVQFSQAQTWSTNGKIGYESFMAYDWGNFPPTGWDTINTYISDFKINVDPINFNP